MPVMADTVRAFAFLRRELEFIGDRGNTTKKTRPDSGGDFAPGKR